MHLTMGKALIAGVAMASVTACSQGPSETGNVEEAVGVDTPAPQLEIKGRIYQLVGESKKEVRTEPIADVHSEELGPDYRKMSLDEIAEAVTPVIFTSSGYEYRAAKPDYELARKVVAGFKEMDEAEKAEREGRVILGGNGNTDDRVADRNNTAFPNTTYMFSELGCTATMISQSVAITASHCVYRSDTNKFFTVNGNHTGNWRAPRYTAGVDGIDNDPFPFNHPYHQAYEVACTAGSIPNCTAISQTEPNGPHLQCYNVAITQAFINSTAELPALSEDYAVIDFGACNGHPGSQTGWLSAANLLTQAQIQVAGTANLWGYPFRATNPVTNGTPALVYYTKWWATPALNGDEQSPNYQEAVLFGMTGTATLPSSTSTEVRYNIDTTGGQSGSSVWRILNNTRQIFAVHRGAPSSASTFNHGRRYDATVRSFVDTSSSWPN